MGSITTKEFDPHKFTKPFQLTKTIHRDVYPAISPDNPANSKNGKIIVITGGGTGIGAVSVPLSLINFVHVSMSLLLSSDIKQAAAEVWCRSGASGIIIAGRRAEKLDEVAQRLRKKYPKSNIISIRADVTVSKDMKNLFDSVMKEFGRPADIVLANAGVMEKHNLIADQDADVWWTSMVTKISIVP